nr:hypothetical protein GCM10025730_50800 [Promicromonospora thailandica]
MRARAVPVLLTVMGTAAGLAAGPEAPAAAQDDPVLLSQGRPAVASALERPEHAARFAVDGDGQTRWSSAFSDPQWIWVDLQQRAEVRRVEIDWEVAHSTAYSVEISDDAESWRVLWSTGAGDGGADSIPVDGTGRYVRVYSTARNGTAGNSIWELRVLGVPEPEPEPQEQEPEPSTRPPSAAPTRQPEPTRSAPAVPAPTPSRPVPERTGPPGSVVYYVVGKGADGKPEKLNDIAGRFLGDRNRWPEIAELTEGTGSPTAGT